MVSATRLSRYAIRLLSVLLALTLVHQGYAGNGQDLDGESGWFPGPGGGSKYHRNLEVYMGPGLIPAIPEKPIEGTAGLLINPTEGKLVQKRIDKNSNKIPGITPDAKIWIEPVGDGSAVLNKYEGQLIIQGHYTVTLRMIDLERHLANLALKGDLQTQGAVTLIRIDAGVDVSMENFESWMLDGAGGALIVLHHDGNLPVSDLLEAAFVADTGIKQIGVVQLDFDHEGTIVRQTAMMIERCGDDVNMEVKESKP